MPAYIDQDVKNGWITGQTINPAVYTADQAGTGVDFTAADGLVSAVVNYGTINNATTGTISFEESSDDSVYTAVSGATSITVSGTGDNTVVVSQPFQRTKRYVRANCDFGGTISIGLAISLLSPKKSS